MAIILFIFGLIVGSFLNCVIYYLEKGRPSLSGRSFCPHCKHILSWKDLIPVFSLLFLKGNCAYCSKKISVQYPLVEFFTGFLFLLAGWRFGLGLDFGFWILIIGFLVVIFVYDLKHYIIPDRIIYSAIIISCVWLLLTGIIGIYTLYEILNTIYAAIGAAVFFLLIVLVTKGKGMGVGDIKLAFLMGLILGWQNTVLALFFSFLSGAIIGIILIVFKKKEMKSEIPFGPFLIFSTFLALFWGNKIISWYLNLLLI